MLMLMDEARARTVPYQLELQVVFEPAFVE